MALLLSTFTLSVMVLLLLQKVQCTVNEAPSEAEIVTHRVISEKIDSNVTEISIESVTYSGEELRTKETQLNVNSATLFIQNDRSSNGTAPIKNSTKMFKSEVTPRKENTSESVQLTTQSIAINSTSKDDDVHSLFSAILDNLSTLLLGENKSTDDSDIAASSSNDSRRSVEGNATLISSIVEPPLPKDIESGGNLNTLKESLEEKVDVNYNLRVTTEERNETEFAVTTAVEDESVRSTNKTHIITPVKESTTTISTDTISKNNFTSTIPPSSPSQQIILILQKECTDETNFSNTFSILNTRNSARSGRSKKIDMNTLSCSTFVHLRFSFDNSAGTIQEAVDVLLMNISSLGNFKLFKIFSTAEDYNQIKLFSPETAKVSKKCEGCDNFYYGKDTIAYIVAAISLGLLLFVIITTFCLRFVCRKQSSSLDLSNTPHLNLKLEDYKLAPIPRPTISLPDCNRELLNSTYNDHPRMEDTILTQSHFNGNFQSNIYSTGQEGKSLSQEMRTYGDKRQCNRVQSLDIKSISRGKATSNWNSNSKEKLNAEFERKLSSGIDNPGFKKWY